MKIFISHKQQDAYTANQIARELNAINVDYYLDLLDSSIEQSGKELTEHIRKNLNNCTDIIVIMSEMTRFSQWVPFEIGMAAQKDMPTATFLRTEIKLPDFLEYWPRLKSPQDIRKYVTVQNKVREDILLENVLNKGYYQRADGNAFDTQRFYRELKNSL